MDRYKLIETDTEIVIHSHNASNRGECIVVPRRHVESLRELSANELESFMRTIQQVCTALNSYLMPMGFTYGSDEGEYTGEVERHLKFHIIPRFMNDDYGQFFAKDRKLADNQIETIVSELKKHFGH